MSERELEAQNQRALWNEVAAHMEDALSGLERAQGLLDDLNVPHIAENLTPHVDAVKRFLGLAKEKASDEISE